MDRYRDIIKAPIITEKSQELATKNNTFVFSVDPKAGKTEIKEAIEKIFNVEVLKVNTLNTYPKKKRVGRYEGRANRIKKAIVKLKEGNSIEF